MVNLWLIVVNNWNNNISGWWLGPFGLFPFRWECRSSQLTKSIIFQRGRAQPPTRSSKEGGVFSQLGPIWYPSSKWGAWSWELSGRAFERAEEDGFWRSGGFWRRNGLVGGFKHGFYMFLFSIIYGMSSFPLTNSHFSRWFFNHQAVVVWRVFSTPRLW